MDLVGQSYDEKSRSIRFRAEKLGSRPWSLDFGGRFSAACFSHA